MSTDGIELAERGQEGGPLVSVPVHMTLQKVSRRSETAGRMLIERWGQGRPRCRASEAIPCSAEVGVGLSPLQRISFLLPSVPLACV